MKLETPGALSELEAIAHVKGVDGIFVGSADLSAAMGHIRRRDWAIAGACGNEIAAAADAAPRMTVRRVRPVIGLLSPEHRYSQAQKWSIVVARRIAP